MQVAARAQRISGLTRVDLDSRVTVPEGSSTMVAFDQRTGRSRGDFPLSAGRGRPGLRVESLPRSSFFAMAPTTCSSRGRSVSTREGASSVRRCRKRSERARASRSPSRSSLRSCSPPVVPTAVRRCGSFGSCGGFWKWRASTGWRPSGSCEAPPKVSPIGYWYAIPGRERVTSSSSRPRAPRISMGAYLVPIEVPKGAGKASVTVVEETPSKLSLSIWDQRAPKLLDRLARGLGPRREDASAAPANRRSAAGDRPHRHRDRRLPTPAGGARPASPGNQAQLGGDQERLEGDRATQEAEPSPRRVHPRGRRDGSQDRRAG